MLVTTWLACGKNVLTKTERIPCEVPFFLVPIPGSCYSHVRARALTHALMHAIVTYETLQETLLASTVTVSAWLKRSFYT